MGYTNSVSLNRLISEVKGSGYDAVLHVGGIWILVCLHILAWIDLPRMPQLLQPLISLSPPNWRKNFSHSKFGRCAETGLCSFKWLISPRTAGEYLGHFRHDYLIKYAYFIKCYFNWVCFHEWSWKKNYKCGSIKQTRKTWFHITRDIASSMTSHYTFSQTGEGCNPKF